MKQDFELLNANMAIISVMIFVNVVIFIMIIVIIVINDFNDELLIYLFLTAV